METDGEEAKWPEYVLLCWVLRVVNEKTDNFVEYLFSVNNGNDDYGNECEREEQSSIEKHKFDNSSAFHSQKWLITKFFVVAVAGRQLSHRCTHIYIGDGFLFHATQSNCVL